MEITETQETLGKILQRKETAPSNGTGLENAYLGFTAALHVVESGDRAAPAQALELYKESSEQTAAAFKEWYEFKQSTLAVLDQHLKNAGLAPVRVSKGGEEKQ